MKSYGVAIQMKSLSHGIVYFLCSSKLLSLLMKSYAVNIQMKPLGETF